MSSPMELASMSNATSCSAAGITTALLLSLLQYRSFTNLQQSKASPDVTRDEYDFIIVGGGTAGCVMASRLSEHMGWKVLLLEAGREEPEGESVPGFLTYFLGSDIDWKYPTQPQNGSCNNKGCTWSRGKTLGGSSSVNVLLYVRGNLQDYDLWKEAGNDGWDADEALRLFKKSENNRDEDIAADPEFHATGGLQDVQRGLFLDKTVDDLKAAFTELGFNETDINGRNQLGWNVGQLTSREGERRSTNRAFIEPFRARRRNLHVQTRAHVTKILINPRTKVAYGVEYMGMHGKRRVFAKKEVILSAGAIASPQLLMLSGVGPRDHLSSLGIPTISNLPVGKNLRDHVTSLSFRFNLQGDRIRNDSLAQRDVDFIKYFQPNDHTGPLAGVGVSQFGVFHRTKYQNDTRPDIRFSVTGFVPSSADVARNCIPIKPFDSVYYQGITINAVNLHPRSVGEILLASNDPMANPLIYPNYFSDPQDLDVLVEGMKIIAQVGDTAAFREAGTVMDRTPMPGCTSLEFGSDEYLKCMARTYTFPSLHAIGTCKMGPASDKEAVVDPQLRVRGVHRLRVVDASVIPQTISGNTNAPVIMVAEKAAELVTGFWSSRIMHDQHREANL